MADGGLRSVVTSFSAVAKDSLWLLASFGLYWTWNLLFLLGPSFSAGGSLAIDDHVPLGFAILLTGSAVCFASAALCERYDRLASGRLFVPLQLTALLLGMICYQLGQVIAPSLAFSGARFAVRIAGSVLIGGGMALFCLEGARLFRAVGHRKTLYLGILSMFGGSTLAYLVTLSPPLLASCPMLLLPILMVYCQRRGFRQYPKPWLYIARPEPRRSIPRGFLIVTALQGIAMGGMFALLRSLGLPANHLANFIAFTIATGILVLTVLPRDLNFNNLIFRLGFPIMASGYFLISLIPGAPLAGNLLFYMGYCYLYLIICCLCVYLARIHRQSAIWVVGLGTGCLLAGQLLGEFAGSMLSEISSVGFATVMTFLYLLLATVLSGTDIAHGWGSVRLGTAEYLSLAMNSACEKLAVEFSLSDREKEVLLLLIRGRTRRYVSEQLNVSEETAKSHTGRIYAKLSVHSHTELVNLVEHYADSFTENPDAP
ncbi:MAG: helix-turn-helix transcriptional regulator [Coriobacteriales bacterium]|jgi:DNA-binding CsgD family transcriptional regulator|nr:helix-turn-helix transcriptional regulator [Coriobacteriales bacterium]